MLQLGKNDLATFVPELHGHLFLDGLMIKADDLFLFLVRCSTATHIGQLQVSSAEHFYDALREDVPQLITGYLVIAVLSPP